MENVEGIIRYLAVFALLWLGEWLYFKLAHRFRIIDKPNERSSHTRVTLRGGGIVFYWGMLLWALFFGCSYPWFFAGLTLICFISFMDDVHSVPSKVRIVFHFSAMLLMFYEWGLFHHFPWWYILVALIFCTGILNAYNFMDGINGITGGYSLVVVATLLYMDLRGEAFVDTSVLWVAFLSLYVFNWFNFRTHARCFAGDVGSVGIAFILLFALGRLVLADGSLYWIILLAVYGVDSIWTIVHRLMLHENIFLPHRKHAYQIMANELRIPHVRVSLFYMALQLLVNIGALSVPSGYRWHYFAAVILLLTAAYVWFMRKYFPKVAK